MMQEAGLGVKSKRLMKAIDRINLRGDCSIIWGAEGISKPWHTKFNRLSPKYTTQWDQLVKVS